MFEKYHNTFKLNCLYSSDVDKICKEQVVNGECCVTEGSVIRINVCWRGAPRYCSSPIEYLPSNMHGIDNRLTTIL